MKSVINCKSISKTFDKTKALQDISLRLEENKIYGLLGRNGAGKTTLLKTISNQLFPTKGQLEVFGENPYENEKVLQRICFVRENNFYPKEFRVRDVFETGEEFYPNWDKNFAHRLIKDFGLDTDKKIKTLSKGMLSSVAIIVGLASRAPLTIYDEAYLGLDASARQMFYDTLLQDYSEFPRTIIYSSHLIDECSNLLEEVMILDKGKLLLQENIDDIKDQSFYIAGQKEKVENHLSNKRILHVEEMGRWVSAAVFCKLSEEEQRKMQRDDIEIQPMSLQKLFVYLTSKNGGEEHEQNQPAI